MRIYSSYHMYKLLPMEEKSQTIKTRFFFRALKCSYFVLKKFRENSQLTLTSPVILCYFILLGVEKLIKSYILKFTRQPGGQSDIVNYVSLNLVR